MSPSCALAWDVNAGMEKTTGKPDHNSANVDHLSTYRFREFTCVELETYISMRVDSSLRKRRQGVMILTDTDICIYIYMCVCVLVRGKIDYFAFSD